MASNETWNLKIIDKTGKASIDEGYTVLGGIRSWLQTEALPGGSGAIIVRPVDSYTINQLKFDILSINSTEIALIRSNKRNGVIVYIARQYPQGISKSLTIYPDSEKIENNQDLCKFDVFTNLQVFEGNAVRFQSENSSATNTIGTCTFTKLDPVTK